MAENETLDVGSSPRWIPVIRAILGGTPAGEIERCIKKSLANSWEAIRKQFRRSGFTLPQVLEASAEGDTAFLEKAYRDSKYHRFVRLIGNCKDFMDGPADVMERTISSQLRIVRNQIRDLLIKKRHCATIAEADARVAGPFENVARDAATFAQPTWEISPRRTQLTSERWRRKPTIWVCCELGNASTAFGSMPNPPERLRPPTLWRNGSRST